MKLFPGTFFIVNFLPKIIVYDTEISLHGFHLFFLVGLLYFINLEVEYLIYSIFNGGCKKHSFS